MTAAKILLTALVVVALVPGTLEAQPRGKNPATSPRGPQGNRGKPRGESFRGRGTVESVGASELKIKVDGELLTAKPTSEARLRVLGTAPRTYLRVGQCVQFPAMIDKKGKSVKDPVKRLTVFTPGKELGPGIVPDTDRPKGDDQPQDLNVDWQPYLVAGHILQLHPKDLILNVPGLSPKLKVELNEELKIDVILDDLKQVKPGDTIDVRKARKAGDTVHIMAATVRMAQPLASSEKPSASRAKAKR